jgi:hypothetical protein
MLPCLLKLLVVFVDEKYEVTTPLPSINMVARSALFGDLVVVIAMFNASWWLPNAYTLAG